MLSALEQERVKAEQERIQEEYEAGPKKDRAAQQARDAQVARDVEASENAFLQQKEEDKSAQLLEAQTCRRRQTEQRAAEKQQAEDLQRSIAQEAKDAVTRQEAERQTDIRRRKQMANKIPSRWSSTPCTTTLIRSSSQRDGAYVQGGPSKHWRSRRR